MIHGALNDLIRERKICLTGYYIDIDKERLVSADYSSMRVNMCVVIDRHGLLDKQDEPPPTYEAASSVTEL